MIVARFAHMQARMYKIMIFKVSEGMSFASTKISYISMQTNATEKLKKRIHNLKKYSMEKEAKELLDFVERIVLNEDIRSYFYDKNKPYRWDLKYKDEDIEAFAEDMSRHPDYIEDARDYIES